MPEIAGAHVPPDVVSRIVEHGQTSPRQRLVAGALDRFHRVVEAVYVERQLGEPAPALALRFASSGGMTLVVLDDLNGLQLATLGQLCGQDLDVRYRDGELEVYCPSLEP